MTNTRRYRAARSVDEALDEILRERARQFDPVVSDALIEIAPRLQAVIN